MADIVCGICGAPAVEVIVKQWERDLPVCAACSAVRMRSMVVHGVKAMGVRRVERFGRHAIIGGMATE